MELIVVVFPDPFSPIITNNLISCNCNTSINKNDSNEVVKKLKKIYRPYFWQK